MEQQQPNGKTRHRHHMGQYGRLFLYNAMPPDDSKEDDIERCLNLALTYSNAPDVSYRAAIMRLSAGNARQPAAITATFLRKTIRTAGLRRHMNGIELAKILIWNTAKNNLRRA